MSSIQNYILEQVAGRKLSQQDAKAMLKELQQKKGKAHQDIAIIGMSGKFPGAKNIEEFWNNLIQGNEGIGEFPEDRAKEWLSCFDNDVVMEMLLGKPLPKNVNIEEVLGGRGGFLDEIDKFDASFFRLSPREAKYMDPAQRLFLEAAWGAIDDAGYGGNKIYGTKTGVFVGKDHATLPMYRLMTEPDAMHLTGSWPGILASRISYIFNLQGPSLVIDTACSAGLVALHTACQSLMNDECEMALAGGIQIQYMAIKEESGPMDLGMVESDDGSVRTFDRKANGTVWSEAVVSVMLKPLAKALEDGDNIHAVIKGSAINNDGASNGITAPNAQAQEDVIVRAWEEAGIHPETISYVEAHGTGTSLGDPIEIKGLTNAFRRYTDKKQFCAIGAAKTNIGHTVAASGVVALIKIVMSMKNQTLPAILNFTEPNPFINFVDSPVYVNDTLRPWERGTTPLRAGISSFGFSGTNAHVILEEAPVRPAASETVTARPHVLALSGRNGDVLKNLVQNYKSFLMTAGAVDLANLCYTANTGRGHYTHRLALIVECLEDLKKKLANISRTDDLSSLLMTGVFYGEHRIVADNKGSSEEGTLTEAGRKKLTQETEGVLAQLAGGEQANGALWEELSRAYVQGAELNWDKLYQNQSLRRISVPGYPLERIRTWADPKKFSTVTAESKKQIEHPLLDRMLVDSISQTIFETVLSIDTHWVLKDHRFMETCIIPGVTYLEWSREACSRLYKGNLHMKDVVFLSPLVVHEEEERTVQTVIKKEADHLAWSIVSRGEPTPLEPEGAWVTHAEGKAYRLTDAKPKVDLDDYRAQAPQFMEGTEFSSSTGQFLIGRRWDNVNEIFTDEGAEKALLRMRLPDEYLHEIAQFHFHPSLLDNSVNPAIKFLEGVYLPFNFKSFKMYGRMPEQYYSFFNKKTKDHKNAETLAYDVILMDEEGNVFAEITDYSIKRMGVIEQVRFRQANGKSNHNYQLGFTAVPLAEDAPSVEHDTVLLLTDGHALGAQLQDKYQAEGKQVIEVALGSSFEKKDDNHYVISAAEQDYVRLLDEIKHREFTQILHLLTVIKTDDINLSDRSIHLEKCVYSLFYLTRALLANKIRQKLDVVVLSSYIQEVTGNEEMIAPEHATILGLGKVLKDEYDHIDCRTIDLDAATSLETIWSELSHRQENLVAYRENQRYVQEFRKLDLESLEVQPVEIKEQGVYVITGGTGGLGLEMAKYLANKAKVNLVLLNRTPMPEKSQWAELVQGSTDAKLVRKLQELLAVEQTGSTVHTYSIDVANEAEVSELMADLRNTHGAINGIIHAAGVAGDGFIINKDEPIFTNVLRPKVQGTLALDRATAQDQLDFFILFSSIASLLAGAGQGDYTAANLFLDSFADERNKRGKRTISINWPSWKETGMAVEYGKTEENGMFMPITTSQALGVMDSVLTYELNRVLPAEVNFSVIVNHADQLPVKLSEQIQLEMARYSVKLGGGNSAKAKKTLEQITLKGKNDYSETEKKLALIWAEVLDLTTIDVFGGFNEVGGDSILSIQLYKEINAVFPNTMEISDVFTYSSIVEQASYIQSQSGELSAEDQELMNLLESLEAGAKNE